LAVFVFLVAIMVIFVAAIINSRSRFCDLKV